MVAGGMAAGRDTTADLDTLLAREAIRVRAEAQEAGHWYLRVD
jgi:hypothetical protein